MDNSFTASTVCEKCRGWGRSLDSGDVCDKCTGRSVTAVSSDEEIYFTFPDYIDFDFRTRKSYIQKVAAFILIVAIVLFILFLTIIVRSLV